MSNSRSIFKKWVSENWTISKPVYKNFGSLIHCGKAFICLGLAVMFWLLDSISRMLFHQ